ncbi:hypothetical protein [Thalassotalea mangrovi]|uniref:Uncharacterized protein n=1 Tax=Thalassotalea mangrovi TaxID=2572245 RepID=A0A4U1B977_9GAMM|nr:hypothetical protein [Thalassotalea mangrovi]TKB46611.1 hypothetical protein E8M12_03390 [Thalassotalea mangrovi]
MKKIIILIVAAAVYLHFYPSPQLNAWWESQKAWMDGHVNEFADTRARVSPSKLLTVMSPHLKKYSKSERSYVEELATSRENIRDYYNEFCSGGNYNRRLNRELQQQLCSTIDQHRLL